MPLTPGTQIGAYEILAPLGAGGMGEVYRARDSRIGREVAVKVISTQFAGDTERRRRFEQEIRASGSLNHPNIVSIFDVGTHDGSPYFVSELLEGETLRDRMGESSLPLKKVIDWALQISRGLAAAHEKGIVHRDLKPENLFLTKDGRVKILDFGLAKLTHPEISGDNVSNLETTPGTKAGVVMGTVGYMSPEQARGKNADARSDIFALGAVLYEMISGRKAFTGDSAVEQMNAILKDEPPPLSGSGRNISPALDRIVSHCLEKNPEERFRSAHDLSFALETLAGDSSASTTVTAAPEATRIPLWPILVGALFLISVFLSFLAGRKSSSATTSPPASKEAAAAFPEFHRITFRKGTIQSARFAPDGHTIVYSAAWDGGAQELFTALPESPEARPLGISNAKVLSISSTGEMAILTEMKPDRSGTLARVSLAGGIPREVLDNVTGASWSPDGKDLAVVHQAGNSCSLEYPLGNVVYKSTNRILQYPAVSPNGDWVALLEVEPEVATAIIAIDRTGKKTVLSPGWADNSGLAWSPDGKEVWFASMRSQAGMIHELSAVSLSGKERTIYRSNSVLYLRDVFKDGRVLMTFGKGNSQISLLAPGETRERDYSWYDWSTCVDLSPDGKTMLFLESGEGSGALRSTFIRKTDGTPAIRLGEIQGMSLSHDGKWVLGVNSAQRSNKLMLIPTGAGETIHFDPGSITSIFYAVLTPDASKAVIWGVDASNQARLFVQDAAGGKPRAISPEVTMIGPVTPDGKFVIALDHSRKAVLYPINGGEARPTRITSTDLDMFIGWSNDGHSVYMHRRWEYPAKVYKVDTLSGQQELFKELRPSDPAGVFATDSVVLTPDAKAYAYSYRRTLWDLYMVQGLK